MRNIEDPHDPLECNCASVESASSCQRLRLRNVKYAHSARTVNCAASSCTPFLLSLCLCLALSATTTMAAPQTSCILCNKEDLRAREPTISGSYEEFIFDHQVSREEAIQALRKYNETLDRQNSCNGMECSPTVLKYCLGPKFVNDHCWCENQHQEEGVPYVPHICYVGEKVYSSSLGSCFAFERVKECCCAPVLVKEWRHISGASVGTPKIALSSLLATLCLLHWLSSRRRYIG